MPILDQRGPPPKVKLPAPPPKRCPDVSSNRTGFCNDIRRSHFSICRQVQPLSFCRWNRWNRWNWCNWWNRFDACRDHCRAFGHFPFFTITVCKTDSVSNCRSCGTEKIRTGIFQLRQVQRLSVSQVERWNRCNWSNRFDTLRAIPSARVRLFEDLGSTYPIREQQ